MAEGLRIYNLFPPLAGDVAAWRRRLPRIAAMDFTAVYVNPFHALGVFRAPLRGQGGHADA